MSEKPKRSNGFTEAELLAAQWSKMQKLASSVPGRGQSMNDSRPRDSSRFEPSRQPRDSSRFEPSRQNHSRGRKEERRRSRSRSRSRESGRGSRHKISKSRSEISDKQTSSSRGRDHLSASFPLQSIERHRERRNSPTYSPYRGDAQDEILISPSRSPSRDRRHKSRSRSHSNSRGGSWRSRSPEERSRNPRAFWTHDKFADVASSSPLRRQLPDDYKPPSPEWVSRAGGVAIMRKKRPNRDAGDNTI